MAQERLEAFFARFIPLEVTNNRFRRRLSPMLDNLGMKGAEVAEVPIEAAARDAELARKHICLESSEALARERCQCEVDPDLRSQPFGHEVAPYNSVLTSTIGRLTFTMHFCMEVAHARSGA